MARAAPFVLFAGVVVASLLRLTVRDAVPVVAALFYATPPPVLAGALFVAAAQFWRHHPATWGVGCLVGAAVTGVVASDLARGPGPLDATSPADVTIVCWNAQRGHQGLRRVVERVHRSPAHVVGVVEAACDEPWQWEVWTDGLPDHDVVRLPGNLVVATRGEIVGTEVLPTEPRSRASRATVRVGDHEVDVVLIDVASNPLRSREARLDRILRSVRPLSGRPAVVMGDFNTPRDSVWFRPWTAEGWSHAFDAAGRGARATYPARLPLLDLDHAWLASRITPLRVHHARDWPSDHRPLILELAVLD